MSGTHLDGAAGARATPPADVAQRRLADALHARRAASIDVSRKALADVWLALWASRLAVWVVSVYAVLTVGFRPTGGAPHSGAPFGDLGEIILGPAVRWDGAFYTSIALHSYHPGPVSAFFPFYPLTIAGLNVALGSVVVAGIAISIASFAVALYLLHRLVAIELGERYARAAVLVLAFFPTSLFFSMVYPEALLVALTIGAVYSARTGHWARAGILGALASATHNSGILIAIPIALLYLYGPRADREQPCEGSLPWWRPRHPLRLEALWLLLAPFGLLAFFAYMQLEFHDALRPLRLNEQIWHRHFELLGGLTGSMSAVWHALHTIANAPSERLFPATNHPYRLAAINIVDAGALLYALIATIGVIRMLPLAYSAYTVIAVVTLVSAPQAVEPLDSLPRYILVLFPLQICTAVWLEDRKRTLPWLACSGVLLGAFTMQFATGRWVA